MGSTPSYGCLSGWRDGAGPHPMPGLCARVALPEIATGEHRVIRGVGDLANRRDFDDFHQVEFVLRVFCPTHDQHVLEALVVVGAIQGRTVAQSVELEPGEGFANGTGVERTRALRPLSY